MHVHVLEARVAVAAARLILETTTALRQFAQGAPALDFGWRVRFRFGWRLTVHARGRCKTFAKHRLESRTSPTTTRFHFKTASALSEFAQISPARNLGWSVLHRLRVLPILSIP